MSITFEDFAAMPLKFLVMPQLNFFGATSKVDSGHTFLTYSHFPGAYVDNIRRLCGDAAKILNYFRATSKGDFEHTFLTYSHFRAGWGICR